jgi:oleandomycin transport system ATP-binding protein
MVSRLRDVQIEVTELAVRLASLDEVFLALTGHAAEEPALPATTGPVKEGVR